MGVQAEVCTPILTCDDQEPGGQRDATASGPYRRGRGHAAPGMWPQHSTGGERVSRWTSLVKLQGAHLSRSSPWEGERGGGWADDGPLDEWAQSPCGGSARPYHLSRLYRI